MLSTLRRLGNNRCIHIVNQFLYSPYYIAFVAIISACANLFGWELPVWYLYAAMAVATVLFAEDALPIVPLVCCGYVTVSASNNPAGNYGSSLFQSKSALIQLAVIGTLLVAALVARVIFDICKPRLVKRTRRTPKLGVGFMLLGLAYLLAGMTPARDYGPQWRSALFGLVQIACLALPYFYFHYTVNWNKVNRLYLAQVFVALGFAVTAEIVGMYVNAFASMAENASFGRGMLYTGWGIYNNVGFMMAFCIPFAFNLTLRLRHSYIYAIIADIFEIALLFTQSRGSILFGTAIFFACAIYTACKLTGKYRWTTVGAGLGFIAAFVVICGIFHEKVACIFAAMNEVGLDDSGRWEIYSEGLRQFAESAQSIFFGNGFYACGNFRWGNLPNDAFLPPRYHNTIVQLLASGGIFALIMYAFHRYQTIRLCLTRRTHERIFALAAVCVLTLTSLVDCHFFNMGPGLVYSVVLVFAEDAFVSRAEDKVAETSAEALTKKCNRVRTDIPAAIDDKLKPWRVVLRRFFCPRQILALQMFHFIVQLS